MSHVSFRSAWLNKPSAARWWRLLLAQSWFYEPYFSHINLFPLGAGVRERRRGGMSVQSGRGYGQWVRSDWDLNLQLEPKLESYHQAGNMNCGSQKKGTHPSQFCDKIMTLLFFWNHYIFMTKLWLCHNHAPKLFPKMIHITFLWQNYNNVKVIFFWNHYIFTKKLWHCPNLVSIVSFLSTTTFLWQNYNNVKVIFFWNHYIFLTKLWLCTNLVSIFSLFSTPTFWWQN